MRIEHDLSTLDWQVAGFIPHIWEMEKNPSFGDAFTPWVKAYVPGSVQASLRDAGIIPDWNLGDRAKECEWVENRHWLYRTRIPDAWVDREARWTLSCLGLDYSGWILVNGESAGTFKGTHIPHRFDVGPLLADQGNVLEIIFDVPPRWLGQFGYTSTMTEWKTRFNYTWDWAPRLVQTGIWDKISLVGEKGDAFREFRCTADADLADGSGILWLKALVEGDGAVDVCCVLGRNGKEIATAVFARSDMAAGVSWKGLPVELWWPNGEGEQPLYDLTCVLRDASGAELDHTEQRTGFRHVAWQSCEGAPAGADPWICVVNGRPVFLQGFNFQPIRVNYADLTPQDYEKRLAVYKDIGTNCFRINACGYLESEVFYRLCDEYGLMVWQEFPLTSSGVDNWPPEDEDAIRGLSEIARSFIARRQHHPSLIAWGGGNEQQGSMDGRKTGMGKPCTIDHPMLARLGQVVREEDPIRHYIPTSPLGPVTSAEAENFGKGLHWAVHGPICAFSSEEEGIAYWKNDDALFRAEIYLPGAASVEGIRRYRGEWEEMPASRDNPYWCRPTPWWNDWDDLTALHGRAPATLEEYVAWSQHRQAEGLAYGMKACKDRFPRIGGSLMWGSHDTTPMPVNTTIMDFDGTPKEVAWALKKVWRGSV